MAKEDAKVIIGGDAQKAVNAIKDVTQHMGSMGKGMNDFLSQATGFFSWQTAAVAGLGAVATGFASLMKNAIDTADEFANMSKRTGVSAESLSRLAYAAKLSDTSNETLQKSLKFLNVALYDVSVGNKSAIDKFKEFGVEVKNADGTMKNAEEALIAVADAYTKQGSEAAKTKLATELFGKAGQELMPMLSEGAGGIKALTDEAERLGLVVSTEFAESSERFNDSLDKLKVASSGVGIQLASEFIPLMDRLSDAIDAGARSGINYGYVIKTFATEVMTLIPPLSTLVNLFRLADDVMPDAPQNYAKMLMSGHEGWKLRDTVSGSGSGKGNSDAQKKAEEEAAYKQLMLEIDNYAARRTMMNPDLLVQGPLASNPLWNDPDINPILTFTDTALTAQLAFIDQSKTAWDIYGKDVQMTFADNMAVMGDAYGQALGGFAGMFEAFANAQGEQMGVMFETARAFRAAEIIASTWTSAQKAYEFGMTFGPWTAGIMMASAIATGIGNLTNLYATQPGNSSINGAGTAPTPNFASRNPQSNSDTGSNKTIKIYYEGLIYGDKDKIARDLYDAFAKAGRDGVGR